MIIKIKLFLQQESHYKGLVSHLLEKLKLTAPNVSICDNTRSLGKYLKYNKAALAATGVELKLMR